MLPSALMVPRISLGEEPGETRFNAIQSLLPSLWRPALWSNCSVVCLPTLKESQLRIAFSAVCVTVTVVLPSARVSTGRAAFCHAQLLVGAQPCGFAASAAAPAATCKPPGARPSGTTDAACIAS